MLVKFLIKFLSINIFSNLSKYILNWLPSIKLVTLKKVNQACCYVKYLSGLQKFIIVCRVKDLYLKIWLVIPLVF